MTVADTTSENPDAMAEHEPLLKVTGLTRHFNVGGMLSRQILHAVDDYSFTIGEGEIVAVVGESGSGKSTIARLLARVYPVTAGEIQYRGRRVDKLRSRRSLAWYRGEVTMVFQDPFSAFHPVHRISHGVMRNLKLHRPELNPQARRQEAERVFEAVGLAPRMLDRYPYEMSGGERQRVGFAQALAVKPKLILADEPVSMLDVSIRAGVLNMMAKLRDEEGVSILYITHDLASARYIADRIIVMYAGHQVEEGMADTVLADPQHPYTQLLMSAAEDPLETDGVPSSDSGEPPRVINPSEGCRFRERCPIAVEMCSQVTPQLKQLGQVKVACHVANGDAAPPVAGAAE
jgi:peptide/nickel transport system ATP-binding protein